MNPGMLQAPLRIGIDRSALVRGADEQKVRIRRQPAEGLDQLAQALVTIEPADETRRPGPCPAGRCRPPAAAQRFLFLPIGSEMRSINSGYVAVADDVERLLSDGKSFKVTLHALAF